MTDTVIVEFEKTKVDELADIIERLAIGRSPERAIERGGVLFTLFDENRPSFTDPTAEHFLIWLPGFLRGVGNFYEGRTAAALDAQIDRLHGPGAAAAIDGAFADGSIFGRD